MDGVKLFLKAILGGVFISLGCTVFLLNDNKLIGSALFSIGLLSIIYLKQSLYTGAICTKYIHDNFIDLLIILLGNCFGCIFTAEGISFTRLYATISDKCNNIIEIKSSDNWISLLILGMLCDLCIYIAVSVKEYQPLFVIIAITVFVFCGFEHCIADVFYYSASTESNSILFLIPVCLGNTIAGVLLERYTKFING